MSANKQQILDWAANGNLAVDHIEQALAVTNSLPSAADNLSFLSRVVLSCAVLLLCSGVIFFFAYNWDDLSRYNKFAIAQGALILSLLPLLRVNLQQPTGQAALFGASLLVGGLLALVGQTYQSGADTYQLFLVWAILITPWVLLARSPALWLLLLVLLNLSVILALDDLAIHSLIAPFTHPGWSLFALNTAALAVWIRVTQQSQHSLLMRWAEHVMGLYCLLIITALSLEYVYADASADGLTLPIWGLFSALGVYLYRQRQLNLLMLSALLLATIFLIVGILAHALMDIVPFDGLFLLLALTVMGLSSASAVWLRQLAQQASLQDLSTEQGASNE